MHHYIDQKCFSFSHIFEFPIFNENVCQMLDIDDLNKFASNFSSNQYLNALCVNIRSIRKNFSQFQVLLSSLNVKFHVIAFVETWLEEKISGGFELESYISYDAFRSVHGGGIRIFVHNSLQSSTISNLCKVDNLFESLFAEITLDTGNKITVGCIYRSPSASVPDFNDALLNEVLPEIRHNKTILLGDININLYNPHGLPHIDDYMNNMLSHGFMPLILYPTRINKDDRTKFSLIDHIFTNIQNQSFSSVLQYELTDHFPVISAIPALEPKSTNEKTFFTRPINETRINKFLGSLEQLVSDFRVSDYETPDSSFSSFVTKFYDLYYKCFPRKAQVKNKCSPWIANDLKECIKKKNKMYKLFRLGHIPRFHYRKYCNLLTATIRLVKNKYYNCYFNTYKHNYKKIFNMVNKLKNRIQSNSVNALEINGVQTSNKTTISNAFNNFFVNIAGEIKQFLPDSRVNFNANIPYSTNSFFLAPITPNSISKVINKFKNKSCHINEIPVAVLKRVAVVITPLLSILINNCFEEGTYPSILKKARVVPLHKKGLKNLMTNYRPISVLSNINKVLETLLHSRISAFINRYKLINDFQYGFQKGRSTTCAVLRLTQYILDAMQKKDITIALFLDLTKAFDCVEHSILLNKLERYGFRNESLSLLRSYLSNRSQYVDLNEQSSELPILHGVPQGSVLGPLLFILYINDLSLVSPNLFKLFFADDTVILNSGKDIAQIADQLNTDLITLVDWLNFNKLSLNIGKTKCMLFSPQNIVAKPPIRINNCSIEYVKHFRYLGIIMDERLSFKQHIAFVKTKLAYLQGFIYSLKPYLTSETLKIVYYSYIYPHLLLHSIIWGGSASTHMATVQVAQNKIVRTMNKAEYTSTNDLYVRFQIAKVSDIFKNQALIFMYNWLRENKYSFLNDLRDYISSPNPHATRNAGNLRLPFPRLNVHKQSVIYNGLTLWNNLAPEIKEASSLASFKKRLHS